MTGFPAAVLWDMDGTLVDTEPYWIDAQYDLIASFGGQWTQEQAHSLVGNDLIVSATYIAKHGNVTLPPEQIIDRLLDVVVERVRHHIPWRPGARELLDELRACGVPCALVTMSYQRLAQAVVASLPAGTFQAVIAGDDVSQGKPHPEPYLVAAARIGAEPAQCVAIEDSPTGIASATAAGMAVLAVEHMVPIEPAPGRTVSTSLAGWSLAKLTALQPQT